MKIRILLEIFKHLCKFQSPNPFIGVFLFIILLGISHSAFARNEFFDSEKIELTEALHRISIEYQVFFSYDQETVQDVVVHYEPDRYENVEHALDRMLTGTSLHYRMFNNRYIILYESHPEAINSLKDMIQHLESVIDKEEKGSRRSSAPPLPALPARTKAFSVVPVSFSVSGTVTDQDGEPLIGVNIQVKGSNKGTSTDFDGKFTLTDIDENAILVISYIGYQTQEVSVAGKYSLSITLVSDSQLLDEVVVVGYGTQRKSDLTGAIGTLSEKEFKERTPTNIQQGMAGRISGVDISQNSGRPGGRSTVRIRGNTSITGSNEPLYVIDGVLLTSTNLSNGVSPLDYIDPNNVESIEVLKDASATAIYGSRGANGVILITTKRPSEEGGQLIYEGSIGFGNLPKKIDLLNAEQFLYIEDLAYKNAEKYGLGSVTTDPRLKRTNPLLFDSSGKPLYDTDWQEEAYRTAINNTHHLSFSGKDKTRSYEVNLGYKNEEGILLNSTLNRYSGRFFIDNQIKEWLKIGSFINYSLQKENQPQAVGSGGISPTRSILQALPIIPVKYPDGSFGRTSDYPGMEGGTQPVQLVNETIRNLNGANMLGNIHTSIKLTENLKYQALFGVNLLNQEVKYYAGHDLPFISEKGDAELSESKFETWQFENYFNYRRVFAEIHAINGLIGVSWEKSGSFSSAIRAKEFVDDYFKYNNLGLASTVNPPSSNSNMNSLNSYFSRWNYTFNDKYIVTISGRIDGASRFSSKNKFAFFPSGAIGWRLSEEDFMKNIQIISNLKLRSSFGITGNSNIPSYQTFTGLGNYSYILEGNRVSGIGIQRMGNPDLKWEKNSQADLGIEIGLFNNRLAIESDVYYKKSDNMLLNAPVPSTSGYKSVMQNIGSMQNIGFEFVLSTVNFEKTDFAWRSKFNISINKNKVLKLTGGQDIIQGSNPVIGNRIIREGEAVNSFYGYIQNGTWRSEQRDEAAKYNRLPGDIRYLDLNGDGIINESDRTIIGNGDPVGYGSIINNISMGNFEFVLDVQFMYGNDVSFDTKGTTQDRVGVTNVFATVLNAWTPENQDTDIAEIRPVSAYIDRLGSSHRIFDGSFIRGRSMSLNYNFSSDLVQSMGIKNARIYASMNNFFLISKYPGYDPEVSTSIENFSRGLDLYSYPKPRMFQVGLSIVL